MNRYKSTDSVKQYAAALEELHRPLEEHWLGIKSRYSLDANGSDIIYKHHVAKLEEIYLRTARQEKPESRFHKRCVSPVTQLYGINGIVSTDPVYARKTRDREDGWTSNMHRDYTKMDKSKRLISRGSDYCRAPVCRGITPESKSATKTKSSRVMNQNSVSSRFEPLHQTNTSADNLKSLTSSFVSQNRSPLAKHGRPSSANAATKKFELQQDQEFLKKNYKHATEPALLNIIQQSRDVRHRCHPNDTHLTQDELVMLGLYRLDENQLGLYQQFVAMLSEMDSFDACHMVEDALKDATTGVAELLEDFGGTEEL